MGLGFFFSAPLGHPAHLLPWEQPFEEEEEERADSGCTGGAASTHLAALKHIPCAGSRCGASAWPCHGCRRAGGTSVPCNPWPLLMWGLPISRSPTCILQRGLSLSGSGGVERGFLQQPLIMPQLSQAAQSLRQPPLSEQPCIFITFPSSHLVPQPDLSQKDWLKTHWSSP